MSCPTCRLLKIALEQLGVDESASEPISRAVGEPLQAAGIRAAKKQVRKARPKLSKALKQVNLKARKRNGDFKANWNQSRVMKEAHKLAKRMR